MYSPIIRTYKTATLILQQDNKWQIFIKGHELLKADSYIAAQKVIDGVLLLQKSRLELPAANQITYY